MTGRRCRAYLVAALVYALAWVLSVTLIGLAYPDRTALAFVGACAEVLAGMGIAVNLARFAESRSRT